MDARTESIERISDACARVIFDGGSILFPSDTGYCIGCDPMRPDAVEKLGDAEATLYLPSAAEFLEHVRGNPLALIAARRLLPAPVTLIAGRPAKGMRVPDEPVARTILERVGPLLAVEVADPSSVTPDLAVENGPPRYDREASVVDLTQQPARLLHEGAISFERLAALFGTMERPKAKARAQS